MFISQFVLRVVVLIIISMLSNPNQESLVNNIEVDASQCVTESTKMVPTAPIKKNENNIENGIDKKDNGVDFDTNATDNESNFVVTVSTEPSKSQTETIVSSKPSNPSESPTETNISLKPSVPPDKSSTQETESHVVTNNAPYDGDTAVPPDAVSDNVDNIANQKSHACDLHDFVLIKTEVNTSYELYNYVTDYYECKSCDHTNTNTHIASANISDSTINNAKAAIVDLVNKLRADNGLNELWVSDKWDEWANTRAVELESFYGHRRPDGSDWLYAIDNNYTIGENIASGRASGNDFYDAFYKSAQHKDLMLDEYAVGIAIGIYVNENGTTYCAMIVIGSY